jgi:hypothetical protein
MANSAFGSNYQPPHNVFPDTDRVTRLDGKKLDTTNLSLQAARSFCEVCGKDAINDNWPTSPWRHMSLEEIARYVPIGKAS